MKGIGAVRLHALIQYFGNLENAWQAHESELLSAGLSQRIIDGFAAIRNKIDPDASIRGYPSKRDQNPHMGRCLIILIN